ncbi:MAG: proline dehydrogenase family protein, partial [Acidimicrobiia bacterium]|nr:proline dehydrogenase family protein [Acidimicrobiia bacterium]
MGSSLESEVSALAHRIADLGAGERSDIVQSSWWSERMLEWAMSHPSFKTQLFRFVDVFPATTGDADVLRHLDEYFSQADVPRTFDLGLDVADRVPFGKAAAASLARRNITRMARQFIVGADPDSAVAGLERLWRAGSGFTVDILGEKTVTEDEADAYARRVDELLAALIAATEAWPPDDLLERDDTGVLPRVNVSIKPTALTSFHDPLSREEALVSAKGRLRPILRRALDAGAHIHFDMEQYDAKDVTLQLFRDLVSEEEFAELSAGVVIQAYLKDSRDDLADLIAFASSAQRRTPITVRLVKGAYWDSETVMARAEDWPVPVYEDIDETEANYERCVRLLHDNHGRVRAAFGTHNLRSLAYAAVVARELGIPDHGYELQMLYGMAPAVQAAVRRLGFRLRVYAPVGELVPGMAYLVRRLLENTSNESFVRRRFMEGRELDALLRAPGVSERELPDLGPPTRRPATDLGSPGPYRHEPIAEWRRVGVRAAFGAAVARVEARIKAGPGLDVAAVIDGHPVGTPARMVSVDPSDSATEVASSASCGRAEADAALDVARRAWPSWARTPVAERAAVLFRAAEWMRLRKEELSALQVFEAGKPWKEADADVCEAIDFCEYYGRQALRLGTGGAVESPPGEANLLSYRGRGVAAVIAPWNFPLAIPT